MLCYTLRHANVCEYDKFCGDWTCPDLKNFNCFYSCHALSWFSSYSGVVVFPDVKFLSIGEGIAYSLEFPLNVVFWGSSFALDYIANFTPCFLECSMSSLNQKVDWTPSEVNVTFGQYKNTSHWYANISWTPLNGEYWVLLSVSDNFGIIMALLSFAI